MKEYDEIKNMKRMRKIADEKSAIDPRVFGIMHKTNLNDFATKIAEFMRKYESDKDKAPNQQGN